MPPSLPPPTPPQPPIPRPNTSSSATTTTSSSEETARVRVLVRIRPHNQKELESSGSIGRSNVLTIDNRKSNNECIDFGNNNCVEENKENSSSSSSSATITVRGVNEDYTSSNYDNGNGSSSSSSGLPPITSTRRLTGNGGVGYTSDGESANNIITSTSSSTSYSKQFTFDAVHGPRSTQCEVYESVKGIVDAVAQGYNGTIVAYGQTGSGKTHTVFGDESCTGLVQRSLRDIFQKITLSQVEETMNDDNCSHDDNNNGDDTSTSSSSNNISSSKATFYASFFEIFNERVYDLLANENKLLENLSLAVREDVTNGVYVEGLKEKQVTNTAEAEALLIKGMSNRHVASTKMNRTSSRSHAVFVLRVRLEHLTSDGLQRVRNSKFTLVDLAGSERQKSTGKNMITKYDILTICLI